MVSTVAELRPGDLVSNGGMSAVFVARAQHPLFAGFQLVIWRLLGGPEKWSHDALYLSQDVGEVQPGGADERVRRLRESLLDRSQW